LCDELSPLGKARKIGTEHGRNAASWVELDEAQAEDIDASGNVFDILDPYGAMTRPLSGEWADGYSLGALVSDVGLDVTTDEQATDIADAYEDAYWQAFEAKVLRKVEAMRGPALPFYHGQAFTIDGYNVGIAWQYQGQTFGGRAVMVMVGDDREHVVDPDELTPLDDDRYCHDCGQVGCIADGRDRS
jgi:hypothetical protein